MNMESIIKQVRADAAHYDEDDAACVARALASDALKHYSIFRHRGDTQAEIYNNTVEHFTNTGCSFELAKVITSYAVVIRNAVGR